MFNKDFFPTPRQVIDQMLVGVDVHNKICLEPSAGKGDIVDALFEYGASRVITCELNAQLQKTLNSRSEFLTSDFLTVQASEISHVNLIVMNPPFSADEKHILHAFDIMPNGCELIALCNANTVKYPNFGGRKTLDYIVKSNGYATYIGKAFDSAERKTDVDIAIVRLFKHGTGENEFEGFFDLDDAEETQSNGIMAYNEIRDVVNRYVGAVKLYDTVQENELLMNKLIGIFPTHSYDDKLRFKFQLKQEDVARDRQQFKITVQKAAWKYIFNKMNMSKYMTRGVMADINAFVETQTNVPFTMRNVFKMLEIIQGTAGSRFDKALLDVFDKFTEHYHDNRFRVEGWKTNSSYMLNRKIIVPYIFERSWKGDQKLSPNYNGRHAMIDDLNKVLCNLSGTDFNNIREAYMYLKSKEIKPNTWYQWGFFRFKGFIKGTIHLEFIDENLWCLVNRKVGELKGFSLPTDMEKKAKKKEADMKRQADPMTTSEEVVTPVNLLPESTQTKKEVTTPVISISSSKPRGYVDGLIINHNEKQHGIEITFPKKPSFESLEWLKAMGYKWSNKQKIWYAKYSTSLFEKTNKFFGMAQSLFTTKLINFQKALESI